MYRRLLDEGIDAPALDALLAAHGASLLDRSVPYLVVAARNLQRSAARRERRRQDLERDASARTTQPSGAFDPAVIVGDRAELDEVMAALGAMDPTYSWPLWWHAAGYDDHEIIDLWNEAGLQPPNPTRANLRKRRERARAQLMGLRNRD